MIVSPTGSYEVELPDDVAQDQDAGIFSFWRKGSESALQLSSFVRREGDQVSAQQRLSERKERTGGNWQDVHIDCPEERAVEVAAAAMVDEYMCQWLHIYLVWPDLTVYATISKPADESPGSESWANQAIRNIRRT